MTPLLFPRVYAIALGSEWVEIRRTRRRLVRETSTRYKTVQVTNYRMIQSPNGIEMLPYTVMKKEPMTVVTFKGGEHVCALSVRDYGLCRGALKLPYLPLEQGGIVEITQAPGIDKLLDGTWREANLSPCLT